MARTLSHHSMMRRILSLWVSFAFLFSMTGVGFAAPPATVDGGAPTVAEGAAPAQASPPAETPEAVNPPETTPAPEPPPAEATPTEPSAPAEEPVVALPSATPAPSEEAQPVTGAPKVEAKSVPVIGGGGAKTAKTAKVAGNVSEAALIAPLALVPPVQVGGNPPLGAGGVRIPDSDLSAGPNAFTFVVNGLTIHLTVTVVDTPSGMEFGFSSDVPVMKVVAKGGEGGANIYTYANGVLADTGLHTPVNPSGKWADISHLDFYFPETGAIEVFKYNDLDRDGSHDEGEPLLPGWTFKVKDSSGTVVDTGETDADGSVLFEGVIVGDYTVEEITADNWVVTTNPYPVPITVTSGSTAVTIASNKPGGGDGETSQPVSVYIGNAEVSDITVIKFDDANGNGERDEGEQSLDGWTLQLLDGQQVVDSAVTVSGSVVFNDVEPGAYGLGEVLQSGWHSTTLPQSITVIAGENETYLIGNQHDPITKTFSLTFEGAPEGATLYATYTLAGGPPVQVELISVGGGVYEGSVELPYGSVISSVTWTALSGGVTYVLGEETDLAEELTADFTNEYTYSASVMGYKFGDENANGTWDEGENGLSGWTIGLYRQVEQVPQISAVTLPAPQPGFELVATTVTGDGGFYSFSGLLPGTYYVSEELRDGWLMTFGSSSPFEVANGAEVGPLNFGNNEPSLPFTEFTFDKSVSSPTADPGDILTYTLTYTLTSESSPWQGPTPVIDDYDEAHLTPVDVGSGVVADGKITWIDTESMTPGETRTITYTMKVNDEMPVGTTQINNVALLDVQGGYDDAEVVEVTVDPVLPFTAFEFDKSANMTTADPGDTVTYKLTYTLTQDSAPWTDAITIVDDYDQAHMTPVDVGSGTVADGKITWVDNEDMQPGETRTITYTMKIASDIDVGTTEIENVALLDVQDGYQDDWTVAVTVEKPATPSGSETTEDPFLPFTGAEWTIMLLAALVAATAGILLRRTGRSTS